VFEDAYPDENHRQRALKELAVHYKIPVLEDPDLKAARHRRAMRAVEELGDDDD
jgi:hypothetical protein